ncbi:MAG: hypothetical protein B7X04_00775 [Parcubacteria group bacterium 21-54-25]|nr:MAG: hypothetical protein B7X04_00775 [Parcubacteria group bacterium 21-54-25]HQU07956.1 hypothetical protein [Candidatus Paceibacterota bacterium]
MTARFLAILALLAPFFFPWPYVVVLTGIALIRYPVIAFVVGLELDALYASRGTGALPLATLLGALATAVALLAHRFIRAHISVT